MYSASVIDMETTSCLRELHITGVPYRIASDPLLDREFSTRYEASAYSFIRTFFSGFADSVVVRTSPSLLVKARYCTSCFAVRRFSELGFDVRLTSRFTCKLISSRVILFMYNRLPTRL